MTGTKWIALWITLCCTVLALCACAKQGAAAEVQPAEPAEQQTQETETGRPETGRPERGKTVEEMIAAKHNDDTPDGAIAPEPEVKAGSGTYTLKKNVDSYLFLGIDSENVPGEGELKGLGQCDTILLLVVDNDAKQYDVLQINRDSVVDVEILDIHGKPTGTSTRQALAYAHYYGNGREESCENVVRAVSRMLGGVPIDGYVSLRYAAIPLLNDALGGIYVTIEDDFSRVYPAFVQGETVELTADNVMYYVRGRMSVGDGTNLSRQRRHLAYLNAFEKRFKEELRGNSAIINELYRLAEPYMVSSMSLKTISNVAMKSLRYKNDGFVTIAGTSRTVTLNGTRYNEFTVDSDSVAEAVLKLYYTKN